MTERGGRVQRVSTGGGEAGQAKCEGERVRVLGTQREGGRKSGRVREAEVVGYRHTVSKHSDSGSRRGGSRARSSSCGCLMRGNPSEGDTDAERSEPVDEGAHSRAELDLCWPCCGWDYAGCSASPVAAAAAAGGNMRPQSSPVSSVLLLFTLLLGLCSSTSFPSNINIGE